MSGNPAGDPSPGSRGSEGYVLFGVLIGITLLGVGLSAAATLWSRVVQRDREAELLFRGEAIVRGLERFQRDRPGTLPETLDDLVEGKYLRRAWVDPMTGRDFRILRAGEEAVPTTARAGVMASEPRPPNPAGGEFGEGDEPGASGEPDEDGERPDPDAPGTIPGITGVASTSDLLSFRAYKGARRYLDWRFEAEVAAAGAGAAGPGASGDRQRPGRRERPERERDPR